MYTHIELEVGAKYKNNLGNICEILWSDEKGNYYVGRYEGAFCPVILTKSGGLASGSTARRQNGNMNYLIEKGC